MEKQLIAYEIGSTLSTDTSEKDHCYGAVRCQLQRNPYISSPIAWTQALNADSIVWCENPAHIVTGVEDRAVGLGGNRGQAHNPTWLHKQARCS